jgi:serine-type D-Ala-D-Ala carboxypeptidase/endopeptidase
MPAAFSPPPQLSDEAIRRMIVHRVDELRLAQGMVVATTKVTERAIIAHGNCKNGSDWLVDGNTIFEIGSITKLFTALLLADLVQRREAELDEPVVRLLPAGEKCRCETDERLRSVISLHDHIPTWG